jgi:hypothetical protein
LFIIMEEKFHREDKNNTEVFLLPCRRIPVVVWCRRGVGDGAGTKMLLQCWVGQTAGGWCGGGDYGRTRLAGW